MKIRNGFVSNSSSSSFVVLGVFMTRKEIEAFKKRIPDLDEDGLFEWCDQQGWFYNEDNDTRQIVGYLLANVSDDSGIKEKEIDFESLNKQTRQIEQLTGKKAKLITGTRMC